jgi:hypothetical protein
VTLIIYLALASLILLSIKNHFCFFEHNFYLTAQEKMMNHEKFGLLGLALVATVLLTTLALTVDAIAENKAQGQMRSQSQERNRDSAPIYGYMMMTESEMQEHRSKMRSFKTEQEREAYRKEHHQKMQERARAKGVTLPEEPPSFAK